MGKATFTDEPSLLLQVAVSGVDGDGTRGRCFTQTEPPQAVNTTEEGPGYVALEDYYLCNESETGSQTGKT